MLQAVSKIIIKNLNSYRIKNEQINKLIVGKQALAFRYKLNYAAESSTASATGEKNSIMRFMIH